MFNIEGVVYPTKLAEALRQLRNARTMIDPGSTASSANFSCGTFVRFSLSIDLASRIVVDASFSSNGCGFMLAAADILADKVRGSDLSDLRGLAAADLNNHVRERIGDIPTNRYECIGAVVKTMRTAFADFRARQIEEFRGEKALICTCFGVSEETVEEFITAGSLTTVDEVAEKCNAGGGCGSCRMLIQEMLDSRP